VKARGTRPKVSLRSIARPIVADEEGQHLARSTLPAGGFWQLEMRLDLVAVAAAVLPLDYAAGLSQIGHDAEGTALVMPGRPPVSRGRAPGS
jgi:hypothetical protein